jgi:hypothetical protein
LRPFHSLGGDAWPGESDRLPFPDAGKKHGSAVK